MSYWKYVKDLGFFDGAKTGSKELILITSPFLIISLIGMLLANLNDRAIMNLWWLWLMPLGFIVSMFWWSYCIYKGWMK